LGNLKQCYLFLNLINQSNYQNQKLDLKMHQNYNFDWKIFPEFSKNFFPNPNKPKTQIIYPQNSINSFSNSNNNFRNSSLDMPKYSKIARNPFHQQQNHTPYFPGRISKPNWIQRKFKSLTSHQLLNSPPNYSRYYNRENDFRSFQNETSSIRHYPSFGSKQLLQSKQDSESINQMTLSKSNNEKNVHEEERKKALKQKLLDVFKNLSETKFI